MLVSLRKLIVLAGIAAINAASCQEAKEQYNWTCQDGSQAYNNAAHVGDLDSEITYNDMCCTDVACSKVSNGRVLHIHSQCVAGSYSIQQTNPPQASPSSSGLPNFGPAGVSPSATPPGAPAATPSGTPAETPAATPSGTPAGTPAATPSGTPASTPVATSSPAPSPQSRTVRNTPPWCLQLHDELMNCEASYGCDSSDHYCFCHKNKEEDPLCRDCHYNYCDACYEQGNKNYKPARQSRCIDCQAAHNIPSINFVCTQCDNKKGCVTGTLNGQTKNSNEFKVFEMEWYFNESIDNWSLRKVTGEVYSTDQNIINMDTNGCTSARNSEGQCVELTPTLLQLSWLEPPPPPTPSPTPSFGSVAESSAPPQCLQSGNELQNCENNNGCTASDPECICYKGKEFDPLCQNCQQNGACGSCLNQQINYSPARNSRCIDCQTAHSNPSAGFECTRCESGKGCVEGRLNGVYQGQQDMRVYNMEWYKKDGEWSVRKTSETPIQGADQNYINNLQGNGCTDNNCNAFTETLVQMSWSTPSGTPAETPAATPSGTPAETPAATPSGTPAETPAATTSGTPAETPAATPSGTPAGTPAATPSGTPASTPVETSSPAPSPQSRTVRNTPPWCLQLHDELMNCEASYGCDSSDPDCFCHKNKEEDPLCRDCHYNYCDACYEQGNKNYKPARQSRCIDCQAAHNIPSINFVCTQCDNKKGCVTGTLNGQTKNSNEFKVFEMEWYFNESIDNWSLRKVTGEVYSTDQNIINMDTNGCTSARNSEGQCVELTPTLLQLSWLEPPPPPTPSPTPSFGSVAESSAPPQCLQSGNELQNCENNNGCTASDPECICYKGKEFDPLCQNCQQNGACGSCLNQQINYSPARNSRCIDCQTAHSNPSAGFECTRCESGKGCVEGRLNGVYQGQQDMRVYNMEWYKKDGEWSVRKTSETPIQGADQNYINNLQGNGCTDNNCNAFTETLVQMSW